jgi:uncharacterized protein (DUF2147 family)
MFPFPTTTPKETRMFKKTLAFAALATASLLASAQTTPVGLWKQIDEKTGDSLAEIRITESGGVLTGKVEKRTAKDAKPTDVCTECTDDRKGKLRLGLEVIRGVKKVEGKDVWEGGKILDPLSGKEYNLRLTPIEGGRKLEARGSIAFIGRTQTWQRLQ